VKVGDLVEWKDKTHIVTKEYAYLFNLQEVGSNYPPSIVDKALVKIYIKSGELKIISKKSE
tara:strand:+ start:34 stop:216 length:183 start_codon:yes stop_codon:yes gene_type:complete